MSYCLNPACASPNNLADDRVCQQCGSALRLQDRYRVLQPIAQGGFGRTFLAADEADPLKPRCVVKQFSPQVGLHDREKASELFRQEAERLQELGTHPQIPELLTYVEQDGHQYLIQTFIDGRNLEQELAEQGPFNEAQIRQLLSDLLPVVQFIHQHQVIHRDIKPANIIRAGTGQLFLVDLGAAKYATGTALGKTGTVIGSAEYIAPEQTRGKPVFASDLYSLGATCIHLLTDLSPFELFDGSSDRWIWRSFLPSPVSPALGEILDKLLQSATSRRYQSASEVLMDLNRKPQSTFTRLLTVCAPAVVMVPLMAIVIHQGLLLLQASRPSAPASPSPSPELPTFVEPKASSKSKFNNPVRPTRTISLATKASLASFLSVAISPDGQTIVGSYREPPNSRFFKTLTDVWDSTGKLRFSLGELLNADTFTISPDNKMLANATNEDTVRVWDLSTGEIVNTLPESNGNRNKIVWVSNEQVLVGSLGQTAVKLWNSVTGEVIGTVGVPNADSGQVSSLALSPSGNILAISYTSGEVKLWNLPARKAIRTIKISSTDDFATSAISPDERILAVIDGSGYLRLWNLNSGELIRTLMESNNEGSSSLTVKPLTISKDGKLIVCGLADGRIKLWNFQTGELLRSLGAHSNGVESIVFSPDNKTLLSGGADGKVKIWQLSQLTQGK